uniref:Dipeptidyl aminopeptidase-like protein 6 n=1 Tax=Callorhinchus milii TaxID=7868 RepID=A0A4W3HAB2_CALMI
MIATQFNVSRDPDRSGSTAEPLNWKGIGLALLVISLIFSLVVLSIVILTPDVLTRKITVPLSLDDIKREEFQTHQPDVQWVSDRHVVFRTREGHVIKQDVETQETVTLVGNSTFVSGSF